MGRAGGRLGITVGAGILGSFTPLGFAGGTLLGGLAGTLLLPEKNTVEGPRATDATTLDSSYGKSIPIGFGAVRQSGNVIWTAGRVEERKRSGGKGGGGQTTVDYQYSETFAVSFGEGPADSIVKLWFDGKVVYDRTGTSDETVKPGLSFRFYPGDEDQQPDSLIEEDVGANLAPAFRGQCYVVFVSLPTTEYGGRKPNIEALVAYKSTTSLPTELSTDIVGGLGTVSDEGFVVDWDRGFVYAFDTSGGTTTTEGIRRLNWRTMVEDRQITAQDALDQTVTSTLRPQATALMTDGAIVMQISTPGATNGDRLVRIDPTSLTETARAGVLTTSVNYEPTPNFTLTKGMANISLIGLIGLEDYVMLQAQSSKDVGLAFVDPSVINYVWSASEFLDTANTPPSTRSMCKGQTGVGFGTGYFTMGNAYVGSSSASLELHELRLGAGAAYSLVGSTQTAVNVNHKVVATLTPADLVPGETLLENAGQGLMFDELDNTVIFHVRADSDSQNYLVKVDPADGTVVWRAAVGGSPNDGRHWNQSRLRQTTVAFMRDSGANSNAYMVDTRDGSVILNGTSFTGASHITGSAGAFLAGPDIWIGLTDTSSTWTKFFLNRADGAAAAVSDVITRIVEKTQLAAADIDVTDLTDNTVDGYMIAREMSARGAIEPLGVAFFFDVVESDYLLKFVERGAASARTIVEDDLAKTQGGETVPQRRSQEVDLPESVTIRYIEKSQDYQGGTQSARRILDPTPAGFSRNKLAFDFPGVFTDGTPAKQLAEKLLYSRWAERTAFDNLMTGWGNLDLDPTDVITLTLNNGESFRVRLADMTIADTLPLDLKGVVEVPGLFSSTAVADFGGGFVPQAVPTTFAFKLLVLDTPLLLDTHEPAARAFCPTYVFGGGYGQGGFQGATVFESDDNATYTETDRIVSEMTWGSIIGTVADPKNGNPWIIDDTTTFTVAFVSQSDVLESVTELEMLNGANHALILKNNGEIEVIQFQNVTDNGDGTFTFDTLLRGRRGTDTMAFNHTTGETFLFLDISDGTIINLDLTDANVQRFYRGVPLSQDLAGAETEALTSQCRALMPYAPVHQAATLSTNDVVITWTRRTRVGGGPGPPSSNFAGEVPLSEDSEEYEVDVITTDQGAPSPARSFTGLTSPTVTYTAAQQATDGFTAPISSITIDVYQISAQVGRGFTQRVTINNIV